MEKHFFLLRLDQVEFTLLKYNNSPHLSQCIPLPPVKCFSLVALVGSRRSWPISSLITKPSQKLQSLMFEFLEAVRNIVSNVVELYALSP